MADVHAEIGRVAADAGLARIHLVAWRDRADPEAGGSEEHASQMAAHWARAGLDVTVRTSTAAGLPAVEQRDGYRVVRRGTRLTVVPRTMVAGLLRRDGPRDALVDVFHGFPLFSPLWAGRPRLGFVHHVHLGTWGILAPRPVAPLAHAVERWVVPFLYRSTSLATPSPSTRDEVVDLLGMDPAQVTVVPNAVDARFAPGGERSPTPLVAAVGRLMPQKGFEAALEAIALARARRPDLRAVVVGEGTSRPALEAEAARLGLADAVDFTGRVSDEDLVGWYRRAWLVVNASRREGWGLTLSEAMACGTPVVATRIPGHVDAVDDGRTGVLVDGVDEMAEAVVGLLDDDERRTALGRRAATTAGARGWGDAALELIRAIATDAVAGGPPGRRRRRDHPRIR